MRSKPDSRVSILTTNSYVVGEYDVNTGDIRWQRVVLANQKVAIQNFLMRHFPVKVEVVAAKAPVLATAPVKEIRGKKVAKVSQRPLLLTSPLSISALAPRGRPENLPYGMFGSCSPVVQRFKLDLPYNHVSS